METLGLRKEDFDVFTISGFAPRMAAIQKQLRPKLQRIGNELVDELVGALNLDLFPHVAKHARRKVNPPNETWCAFGPSPRGYKRYGYLAFCISAAGAHARVVVKSEAEGRQEIARHIKSKASQLARHFGRIPLARYDKWDFKTLPEPDSTSEQFWQELAEVLSKRTGELDVGLGWGIEEAIRLKRGEVVGAFKELKPLFELCRVEF